EKPANLLAPGDQPPVACAACHDPHAFTEPKEGRYGPLSHQLRLSGEVTMPNGVTVDAEESALCVSCHANKRDLVYKADFLAKKNSRGPHGNTQADNFYGITAAAFDYDQGDYGKSAHASVVKEGCIQCHMASNPAAPEGAVADNNEVIVSHGETLLNTAGGHTWNMTGTYQGQEIENVGSCNTDGCHAGSPLTSFNRKAYGDYDGDGATEGIQDEIDGLIKLLEAQLPRDDKGNIPGSGFDKMKLSDAQLKAFWNYYLVKSDGSGGVHNTAYSVEVLQRTYKQLTGQDVPGATIR
ncbi:MAG: cytochrome c3 family protein, partial [Dehalococcoidales bacterium]|nr:cytochrome c3 family protein [Dehalococcoidales bacterium]